jgi:hypothetical protein
LSLFLAFYSSKDLRIIGNDSLRGVFALVRLDSELFVKIKVAAHGVQYGSLKSDDVLK